jgi:hypothetical protein
MGAAVPAGAGGASSFLPQPAIASTNATRALRNSWVLMEISTGMAGVDYWAVRAAWGRRRAAALREPQRWRTVQEMMYAPAPLDSSLPSAARNSMRVLATREPSRITSARSSKASPIAGRR